MAYFFIIAAVLSRLLPHPPNFAPIAALALFGGTYLDRKQAIIIPLVAMFLSDLYLGFAEISVVIAVYFSFILITLLGMWLKNHKNLLNLVGVSLTGSVLFFVITNFAVWSGTPWYSKNLAGLLQCYYLAIPFFRNTVLGDLFYVGVFFGLYELISHYLVRRTKWQESKVKS